MVPHEEPEHASGISGAKMCRTVSSGEQAAPQHCALCCSRAAAHLGSRSCSRAVSREESPQKCWMQGLCVLSHLCMHRIPGCHWGPAGRAAGSCEEQASGFAQHHDNPWTHFLHPCSQQDQTTFQQTPARPHCSISLPGLTEQGQVSAWLWWQMPVKSPWDRQKNTRFKLQLFPFCMFWAQQWSHLT